MLRFRVPCVVGLALLSSCSSPTITSTERYPTAPSGVYGTYHLPRTVLTLKVDFPPPKSAALEASKWARVLDHAKYAQAGGTKPATPGPATTPDWAPPDIKSSPVPGSGDKPSANVAEPPGGATRIALLKNVEPDPRARLFYNFRQNAFFEDTFSVTTDERNLLAAISSTSADKSADIAVAIAQLVFMGATGTPAGVPKGFSFNPNPIELAFDPTEDSELAYAKRILWAQKELCFLFGEAEVRRPVSRPMCTNVTRGRGPLNLQDREALVERARGEPGIYYRKPRSEPVQILTASGTLVWSGVIPIVQKDEMYEVSYKRCPFVTCEMETKFASGVLTEIKYKKPSEILGFLQIPVRVAQVVVSIPLAGAQNDKAIADAQAGLINSQANLITAQRNLLRLRTTVSGSEIVASP